MQDSMILEGERKLIEQARRNGRRVLIVTTVVLLLIAVRGATLWQGLPGQVTVGWLGNVCSGHEAMAGLCLREKSFWTVFAQISQGCVVLLFSWLLFELGPLRSMMVRADRFAFGHLGRQLESLNIIIHDVLVTVVLGGAAVALGLNNWASWSLSATAKDTHIIYGGLLLALLGPMVIAVGMIASAAWKIEQLHHSRS